MRAINHQTETSAQGLRFLISLRTFDKHEDKLEYYPVITVFANVLFIALIPLCIFHELPEGIFFPHACSKLHSLMPADIARHKKGRSATVWP